MATDLKQITQEEVEKILRRNLDLGEDVRIGKYDRISDLVKNDGGSFEPIDLLEIMHELGIDGWKYSSGEKLTDEGFRMLTYAVLGEERIPKDVYALLDIIECAKGQKPVVATDEVAEMMTLEYLMRMTEYDARNKPHSL